jgi:hypothetical protein
VRPELHQRLNADGGRAIGIEHARAGTRHGHADSPEEPRERFGIRHASVDRLQHVLQFVRDERRAFRIHQSRADVDTDVADAAGPACEAHAAVEWSPRRHVIIDVDDQRRAGDAPDHRVEGRGRRARPAHQVGDPWLERSHAGNACRQRRWVNEGHTGSQLGRDGEQERGSEH